ncbi:MAG: hypothetical protein NUV54_01510 [Candidatus Taylorbacteria bacterium]|nr:hypothetical protein [Candidatus Taylorbacteria bacterium]
MRYEAIIFYVLLIDSIGANLVVWFGRRWYTEHFRIFSRVFPPASGWALYYLVLVLWIGALLSRLGIL